MREVFLTLLGMTIRRTSRTTATAQIAAVLCAGALALTGLAACSSGSDGSGDSSSSSEAPSSSANEVKAGDPAARAELGPKALSGDEVPGLALQEVPAEQLDQVSNSAANLTAQADFKADPPECSVAAMGASPSSTASTVARMATAEDTPNVVYTVSLSKSGEDKVDRAQVFDQCAQATVTLDTPAPNGGEPTPTVYQISNERIDDPAPEGVENFVAGRSNSDANIAGQQVSIGAVQISGTVDGVEILATATSASGPVPPEAEARALDVFNRQVAKIQQA